MNSLNITCRRGIDNITSFIQSKINIDNNNKIVKKIALLALSIFAATLLAAVSICLFSAVGLIGSSSLALYVTLAITGSGSLIVFGASFYYLKKMKTERTFIPISGIHRKISGQQDTYSINVLQQSNEDINRCGFHALKNALCILNTEYRGVKFEFICKTDVEYLAEAELDDATIPALSALWNSTFVEDKDPQTLSMFNFIDLNTLKAGAAGITPDTLSYVANLRDVSLKLKTEESFQHVILMGTAGHWSTIVIEKNQSSVKFYGLNSYGGDSCIAQNVKTLKGILESIELFVENVYNFSCSEPFPKMDRNHVKRYVDRLKYSTDFFTRVGWNQKHESVQKAIQAAYDYEAFNYGSASYIYDPLIVEIKTKLLKL